MMSRRERVEERVDHPGRRVAVDLDDQLGAARGHRRGQMLNRKIAHAGIQRNRQRDQILDAVAVKRRVHQREQRAEAVAENRDLLDLAMNLDRTDRVGDVLVYVRVETAPLVLRLRRNPVDQVDLEALVDQMRNQAAPRLQVKYEWALDQRVDEQQRHPMTRRAARLVVA